jgi:hypothetical protein
VFPKFYKAKAAIIPAAAKTPASSFPAEFPVTVAGALDVAERAVDEVGLVTVLEAAVPVAEAAAACVPDAEALFEPAPAISQISEATCWVSMRVLVLGTWWTVFVK